MSATQIQKKSQRDRDRIQKISTKKKTEELVNGMAVRNAILEQLGHKVEEEELIQISAKAAGDEAAAWAAKCADEKHQFPSRSLCCSVSIALQSQWAVKIEIEHEGNIRTTEQMCALIREERAETLARLEKGKNSARARRAWSLLQKHLKK
jgi:hypothetical protein